MTPRICSVHTHSSLCDGHNSLAEMAEAAFKAGVKYFGASGHGNTPIPFDIGNVMGSDISAYLAELSRLRAEYEGRMEILYGIEWDSCAGQPLPEGLDYYIGSVHNLHDEISGNYYSVDWRKPGLSECCREMFGGDFSALVRAYYASLAAVAEKEPEIWGHFDLITKLNGDGSLFDESSDDYRKAALSALDAVNPRKTLLEINTGAVYRGYRTAPYPALFILKQWKSMGGRIIITSDAHSTEAIVFGYDTAAELAKEAGFKESMILTLSGQINCPLLFCKDK